MKNLLLILLLFFCFNSFSQQQKIISDYTIKYSVSNSDSNTKDDFENASKTVYVKAKEVRVDLTSNSFDQTIFYDDNSGEATVLKSIGASKYISSYNAKEWQSENGLYSGIKVSLTNNAKKILNYDCKEALLQLKNGSIYTVYYIPGVVPSVTENNFEFKMVPGLILQYETNVGNKKIIYTANYLNFDPVPSFRFEIPKSGYKILH